MRTFPRIRLNSENTKTIVLVLTILSSLIASNAGCKSALQRQDVRPLALRDVPAQRLAYRFEPDVGPPPGAKEDAIDKLNAVQNDFNTRRPDDALLRTVASPDGQRTLALYGTEDEPSATFRIDIYSSDGKFLRNLTPPNFSCVFPETAVWSPDGNFISFIAHKRIEPSPTPTPPPALAEIAESTPTPSATVAPAFPSVPVLNTEQIYICNRDGFDLKPLTSREGLIYFYFAWSPDSQALVVLACKEDEWDVRERQHKLPWGRPRLIGLDGKERLLDDRLTEALPAWSPDASKVATGFENESEMDVTIYDAALSKPTQARIPLREAMIAASLAYEQGTSKGGTRSNSGAPAGSTSEGASGATSGSAVPATAPRGASGSGNRASASSAAAASAGASGSSAKTLPPSFNPIVNLEWVSPDKLYVQTAYVRLLQNDTINTFQRWHLLILSPQAAVLK